MLLLASRGSSRQFHDFITNMVVSNRALDRINTTLLAAVVLLSWGFVLYASWVSAQWQLEATAGTRRHP